jgi:hypothetical protein
MTILLCLLSLLLVQQPAPAQFGTISGQLRDPKGAPMPALRVFAVPVEADAVDTLSSIALTDDGGRYRLEGVLPGRYLIAAGLLDSPSYYPGVTVRNQGQILTIAAGQAITNVDFAYAFPNPPPQLSGRVELDDGSPLPVGTLQGFRLILSSKSARWAVTQPFTNSQGLFFFQSVVVPAEYSFTVAPLPLGYYLKSATFGNVDLTSAPLTLTEDLKTEIRVVLTKTRPAGVPPGVRVGGRILNWAAPMRLVAVTRVADPVRPGEVINAVATVIPSGDGAYEFEGVPPGRYMLVARTGVKGVPLDVAGNDVTVDLVVTAGVPVVLSSTSVESITGTVEVGNGAIPKFGLGFSTTRAPQAATHTAEVSGKEFAISLPYGEYRINVLGLPTGYIVESVTAGPLDLTYPFLVTNDGIADRFTGSPVPSTGITVRLKAPTLEK